MGKIPENYQYFKESAVMILLDDQNRLILTKRSRLVKSHKGQYSFPGGKKDPEDKTFLDTALRETQEEIGLFPHQIKNIQELSPSFSPRGYLIQPFLGRLTGRAVFRKSEDEVERILRVPLEFFRQTEPVFRIYKIQGARVRADFYHFGPHVIWGATARIISQMKHKHYFFQ